MKRFLPPDNAVLADDNVSRLIIERIRDAGLDIASVRIIGSGASDEDVLAAAHRWHRVLITEDRDFGELVIRQQLIPTAHSVDLSSPVIARSEATKQSRAAATGAGLSGLRRFARNDGVLSQ